MNASELKALLDADPFRPFAVSTTRIGRFTVASPRHALLTATALHVGRDVDASTGIPAEASIIPVVQIVKVEPA
ncbi:MAG TPA: hypothetical protein VF796_19815 [Humisphaera sp.]